MYYICVYTCTLPDMHDPKKVDSFNYITQFYKSFHTSHCLDHETISTSGAELEIEKERLSGWAIGKSPFVVDFPIKNGDFP